jgi:hypothetical protein
MIAATIAFFAWGLAVPDGPFLASAGSNVLGGLLAIIVSTLLGVAGRFFAAKPDAAKPDVPTPDAAKPDASESG